MFKRIFISALLTSLMLVISTVTSYADETYNFYFQKAPGPVTVNQGTNGTSAVAPTVAMDANGQVVAVPTAAVPAATTLTVANAVAAETGQTNRARWYLALGVMTTGYGGSPSATDRAKGAPMLDRQAATVALELGVLDRLGLLAEANVNTEHKYSAEVMDGFGNGKSPGKEFKQSRSIAYSLGAAFDLIKNGSERTAIFVMGPVAGISAYNILKYDQRTNNGLLTSDGFKYNFSPFAGLRARLLMFDKAGIEASVRWVPRVKQGQFRGAVAWAF